MTEDELRVRLERLVEETLAEMLRSERADLLCSPSSPAPVQLSALVMIAENCSIVTTVAPTRFAFSPTRSFALGVTLAGMSAKKNTPC
jgi:hypothetical protein